MISDAQIAPRALAATDEMTYSSIIEELGGRKGEKLLIRFGDWLVRREMITRYELFMGLNSAFANNCRIGDAMVRLRLLDRYTVEHEASAYDAFCAFQDTPS